MASDQHALKSSRSSSDYEKIRLEARKPAKLRSKAILTPKGIAVTPRRYEADETVVAEKLEHFRKTGEFKNPFRRAGAYYGFIQALIDLGIDKVWSYKVVRAKMEEVMRRMRVKGRSENVWEAFVGRKSRNAMMANDIFGKIVLNARLLQRIRGWHPYGEKLRQMLSCVDILAGDRIGNTVLPAYRLNTRFSGYNEVKPVNELKKTTMKK